MFKKIHIPIDNSDYSLYCTDMGISLAARFGGQLTGSHVYGASLHDRRFRDMEVGLPQHCREEERLKKSRAVHNSLIEDGLRLISDAYLDSFKKKCLKAGIPFECKLREGKNWLELVKEMRAHPYDLAIMGIKGLGAINGSLIGGVCERVIRKVRIDVLAIKNSKPIQEKIVVAIDGSDHSFSAFHKGLVLTKAFNLKMEALSVYDPHFHRRAFKALVGLLSEEREKRFRFKEQETLHDEIIDDGLGKVYQAYLNRAVDMGKKEGIEVGTTLLTGKAYHEICRYLENDSTSLLVMGRFGAHQVEESDIGSTAENLLRLAPCNVLITGSSS